MNNQFKSMPTAQNGYILLMSAIFLVILVASAAHFFYRATENTSMTGISRDSSKSLLLAESAMEHLRGQFVRGRLNTDDTTRVASCEVNGVTSDDCESGIILTNMADPVLNLFDYMYFISSTTALERTTPDLLQRVSNGEAQATAASQLTSARITEATSRLRINDLFNNGASLQPRLYVLSANSRLTASAATSWEAESSPEKAAAWIEIIINPVDASAIDLIVQAVGQVGKAKSYTQMLVGSFAAGNLIGNISPLTEASNINR